VATALALWERQLIRQSRTVLGWCECFRCGKTFDRNGAQDPNGDHCNACYNRGLLPTVDKQGRPDRETILRAAVIQAAIRVEAALSLTDRDRPTHPMVLRALGELSSAVVALSAWESANGESE